MPKLNRRRLFSHYFENQKGVVHLLVPLILLAGLVAGVYLVTNGNPLKLFSKASNPPIAFKGLNGETLPVNSQNIPQVMLNNRNVGVGQSAPDVSIYLTSPLGEPVFATPAPSATATPMPTINPTTSSSYLTATAACSSGDSLNPTNHIDLSVSGRVPQPSSDGIWSTITDEETGQTIIYGYGDRYQNLNANFHGVIASIRNQGSMTLQGDGRTYTIKAYYASFNSGVPTLSNPIIQTIFSKTCSSVGVGTSARILGVGSANLTPISGTTAYRIAENPTDLDNTPFSYYPEGSVILSYAFKDRTLGVKTIFVDFEDVNGQVERRSAQIEIVSATPSPTPAPTCDPTQTICFDKNEVTVTVEKNGLNNGSHWIAPAFKLIGKGSKSFALRTEDFPYSDNNGIGVTPSGGGFADNTNLDVYAQVPKEGVPFGTYSGIVRLATDGGYTPSPYFVKLTIIYQQGPANPANSVPESISATVKIGDYDNYPAFVFNYPGLHVVEVQTVATENSKYFYSAFANFSNNALVNNSINLRTGIGMNFNPSPGVYKGYFKFLDTNYNRIEILRVPYEFTLVSPTPSPTPIPSLSVSCTGSYNSGKSITWVVNVTPNTGNISYGWTLGGVTGQSGFGATTTASYADCGEKQATVKVTKDGISQQANCSPTRIPDAACSAPAPTPIQPNPIPDYKGVYLESVPSVSVFFPDSPIPTQPTRVFAVLKDANGNVVKNQSNLQYVWSMDLTGGLFPIIQIMPEPSCTNGIMPPCPQDHANIRVVKYNSGVSANNINLKVINRINQQVVATSKFYINIVPAGNFVKINNVRPGGGETLKAGQTIPVTWQSQTQSKVDYYNVYYVYYKDGKPAGGFVGSSQYIPGQSSPTQVKWTIPAELKDKSVRINVQAMVKSIVSGAGVSQDYFFVK